MGDLSKFVQRLMVPDPPPSLDEGRTARDYIPLGPGLTEITPDDARAAILAERDTFIEQSILDSQIGRRTFPSALNVGFATPRTVGAEEIIRLSNVSQLSKAQPFFTDPGSGEVDFNQEPLPFVFPRSSGASLQERDDKALFPAAVPRSTGTLRSLEAARPR